MLKFIALSVIVALSGAEAFWAACPGFNGVTPRQITSASCSGNLCTVTRGEPLVADAFLTFNQAHQALNVRVTAYILGIGVNLPQTPPNDNACNSISRDGDFHGCPTTPGVEKVWQINMLIPTNYPAFQNTRVRFQLLENNQVVACADVTATLT